MATSTDPLAALRAIRLPAAPPSSLAELLMLAAAAGIACGLLVVAMLALRTALARRRSPVSEALAALTASCGLPAAERLAIHAAALRRYVAVTAGEHAARAENSAWLSQLDATFATDAFTAGDGQVFGEALYWPLDHIDPDAADALLRGLLRKVKA